MSNAEEPKKNALELTIDWHGAAQTKQVHHANQVIVQVVEHELNLSFFQFSLPVVLGSAEDVQRQLRGTEWIQPDCLARLNISSRTAKGLIKALEKQFDEQGNLIGGKDEDDE